MATMYRWPSLRFLPSRMIRSVWSGLVALRVDLGPDQLPLAGVGVDQDDRLLRLERLAHVRDRHGAGLRSNAVRVVQPGTRVTMRTPGLNPSLG